METKNRNEYGQALVEYGMIILLAGVVLLIALSMAGSAIESSPGFIDFIDGLVMDAALPPLDNVDTDITHAEKHGITFSEAARNCFKNNGADMAFFRSSDEHWAEVCKLDEEVDDQRYAIQIYTKIKGKWQEITIFGDSSWSSLADVEAYLTDGAGYSHVVGP